MKQSKLLGIDMTGFDMSRYVKQLRGIVKWKKNRGRGLLNFNVGSGKTLCGVIAHKKMQQKDKNRSTIVVVPTQPLLEQWKKEIEVFNLKNIEVYIINTALTSNLSCNLLVLDECHLYCSSERIKILNLKHNWCLGLTGTPYRKDGLEYKLLSYIPIVDTIMYDDSVKLGYVEDVKIYNLAVPLSKEDKFKLRNHNIKFVESLKFFNDFKEMMSCLNKHNALQYSTKYSTQGNYIDPKIVQISAVNGNRHMQQRKKLLNVSQAKLDEVINILKVFDERCLTFGLDTSFSDKITEAFPKEAISYHTNVEPIIIKVRKEKFYKTEKAAINFKEKTAYSKIKKTEDGWLVYWNINKKLPEKDSLEYILNKFKNPVANLRIINTALKLKQGVSINELALVIITSRHGSWNDFEQILGRACRLYEGKRPILINLYHPSTQDEKWLREATKNFKNNTKWITNINEIDR